MHATIPGARFGMATFGELVSDPSRVTMLLSLMDGLARPASELASLAGVTASTASSHLGRLLRGGLVRAERQGRHRYFRLASERVADALEAVALQAVALQAVPGQRLLPSNPTRAALSHARTCYLHLAGRLGVAWLAALESQRLLRINDGALTLAPRGVVRFERLGLAMAQWPAGRPCLDWTERRNHLGGPLGTLLTEHLFTLKWLARREERRALRITTRGRSGFERFGLSAALLG